MKIDKLLELDNIAEDLDELDKIGRRVVDDYDADRDSRKRWEDNSEDSTKLALQVKEEKSDPWPGSANVKYPLLTTASIQFAARTFPMIVNDRNVVKGAVYGLDDGTKRKKADKIAMHMNYQVLEDMEGWQDDKDLLLHVLPITGSCFMKTYQQRKAVSELVLPKDLVVDYYTKSMREAELTGRVTHHLWVKPNELVEKQRSGDWLTVDVGKPVETEENTEIARQGTSYDEDMPHKFLEQHRWMDLDKDGYQEPYIITVHEATRKVMSIVRRYDDMSVFRDEKGGVVRIVPGQFFTKYPFIPSPDGGFYDIGFGALIGPLNDVASTIINQLVDAGTLNNMGGGFLGRGMRMKSGPIKFRPGQWHSVDIAGDDLRRGIVPLPVKDPSSVLFSLLGLIIESGEKLGSITDPMMGESPGTHVPATTTMALIEQGGKVLSAIAKRVHRALHEELRKIYQLNKMYLPDEEYFRVLDQPEEQMTISKSDYKGDDTDVQPYSDPSMVSDMQKMKRAEAIVGFLDRPEVEPKEILRRYFESIQEPNPEMLFKKEQGPDIQMLMELADKENEKAKLEIRKEEIAIKRFEIEAQVLESRARTMKIMAEAEMETPEPQYGDAVDKLAALKQSVDSEMEEPDGGMGQQGGVPGMDVPPDDQEGF